MSDSLSVSWDAKDRASAKWRHGKELRHTKKVNRRLVSETIALPNNRLTNRRTDRWTNGQKDQWTDAPSYRVVVHGFKACALIPICCLWQEMIEIPRITKGGDNRNRRPNLFQNLDPVGRKLQDSINLLQQSLQEGPEQLGKREQTTTRRIRCINNIALLMQLRMNNIINYLNRSSGKRSSRFLMQYSKLRCFCLKKCY